MSFLRLILRQHPFRCRQERLAVCTQQAACVGVDAQGLSAAAKLHEPVFQSRDALRLTAPVHPPAGSGKKGACTVKGIRHFF